MSWIIASFGSGSQGRYHTATTQSLFGHSGESMSQSSLAIFTHNLYSIPSTTCHNRVQNLINSEFEGVVTWDRPSYLLGRACQFHGIQSFWAVEFRANFLGSHFVLAASEFSLRSIGVISPPIFRLPVAWHVTRNPARNIILMVIFLAKRVLTSRKNVNNDCISK